MKKVFILFFVVACITFCMNEAFGQQANGINKLLCFQGTGDGYGDNGTCNITNNAASKMSAVLNTIDNDTNPYNNYAGVYSDNKFIYGKGLSALSSLRFSYSGTSPYGGAPRFAIPFDGNGDGKTDLAIPNVAGTEEYVVAAAADCNDGAGNVNLSLPTCKFYHNTFGGPYVGLSQLTAAFPNAKIAKDNYVFIVADAPGLWTISNVSFGAPGNN